MKQKMLCIAALAAALAGCSTPPPPPAPAAAPKPTEKPKAKPAKSRQTVCRVEVRAASKNVQGFAEALATDVRGEMARQGYFMSAANDGPDAVAIEMSVGRKEVARLDVWFACDATAAVKAVSPDGRLLGEKAFAAKGVRGRTAAEAEEGIRKALAAQINAWLPAVLPSPKAAKGTKR